MNSFPRILAHHTEARGGDTALRHKRLGIWAEWTWAELAREVRTTACGLSALGVGAGDKVLIIDRNIPQLYWALIACQALGCQPIPVDVDSEAKEFFRLLENWQPRIAFVPDQQHVDMLLALKGSGHRLDRIVFVEGRGIGRYDDEVLINLRDLQDIGNKYDVAHRGIYERALDRAAESDVAIVLRTAGTSGTPREVSLTHQNLIFAAQAIAESERITAKDELMAYLPQSWACGVLFAYCIWMVVGCKLNCPESDHTILNDMREIGPTFFYAPARFYKQILSQANLRMRSSPKLDRAIYFRACDFVSNINLKQREGEKLSFADKLLLLGARWFVFEPFKRVYGLSRMRVALSGMESIPRDVLAFFRAIKLNLKQSYGVTEASGCTSINPDGKVEWNIISPALRGLEIRLDDSGQILMRGPSVHRFASATANETEMTNGWLKTEDIGAVDADGNIRLVDRFDDISKHSAPQAIVIECILKASPYIKDAVVFRASLDFLAAIITIDCEVVGVWADGRNVRYSDRADLVSQEEVRELIKAEISNANRTLSSDATHLSVIRRFVILHRNFEKKGGELTRQNTICRRVIGERFEDLITALFAGAKNAVIEDRGKLVEFALVDVIRPDRAITELNSGELEHAR